MKFKQLKEQVQSSVVLSQERKEQLSRCVEDYRKLAHVDKDISITEGMINDWALNEVCVKNNVQQYDLRHVLLGEDVTLDQAAREMEAQVTAAKSKNQVSAVLDRALQVAERKQGEGETGDFPNILLVSDAGFGKTDMVRQWANKNHINLVTKNLGQMGPEAFAGIVARDADDPRYATRLGTNEMIRELSKPRSVLFLDEYNRSKSEIRGALLTLVQNHMTWDPTQENNEHFLENFLFTVAAINPPNSSYKGAKELDPAEKSRFRKVVMQPDPMEHLAYLRKVYTEKIEKAQNPVAKKSAEGRLKLAETILSSPNFSYDTSKDIDQNEDNFDYWPLNYRSFKKVLDECDGTKEDLLSIWNDYCNADKKSTIEGILHNYVDVDDKANDAIKGDTDSAVFSKTKSNRQKIIDKFGDILGS